MSTPGTSIQGIVTHSSVRRRLNRRIRRFSLSIGTIGILITVLVYVGSAFSALRGLKESNRRTLSEITCANSTCDTSIFVADWSFEGCDYLIDTRTRYLITTPTPTAEHPAGLASLDYSDTSFIAGFRQPASYNTPDKLVWRLYSRPLDMDNKKLEIIIGYQEKAPTKMLDTPSGQIRDVDSKLKQEANKIAESFSNHKTASWGARTVLAADGFQIVDANTKQVVARGEWLPSFLPKDVRLPAPGRVSYFVYEGDLYVVQTDGDGQLIATSLAPVGGLWLFASSCALAFFSTSVIASIFSRKFLGSYFALTGTQIPSLEKAFQSGEGQRVEFKRGLSQDDAKTGNVEDELLKSMAAFANTNDGAIFIGIDDAGHVRGLDLDFTQRDRLERKIRQLVRNRIKPTPPFEVTFEEVRGFAIAKVSVARGEAPAYLMAMKLRQFVAEPPEFGFLAFVKYRGNNALLARSAARRGGLPVMRTELFRIKASALSSTCWGQRWQTVNGRVTVPGTSLSKVTSPLGAAYRWLS